jgi:competence protein ComEA
MTYDIEESESQDQADSPGGLININTASKEQLMTLPGIGEKVAGRIIEYREKNGSFSKTEDIMKISGIKEKLFSKIRDKITV